LNWRAIYGGKVLTGEPFSGKAVDLESHLNEKRLNWRFI
jgi:hypothetical protein